MASVKRPSSSPGSTNGSSAGPSSKKPKVDEDSFNCSFEDELALFESAEMEEALRKQRWRRPSVSPFDPSTDPLIFQQIDIDHYIGEPIPGMPGAQGGPIPILRMIGVTNGGHSVCAHIHGFLPYFFIPAPNDSFTNEHCSIFRSSLNDAVMADMRSNREGIQHAVLAVEICQKCSMYGFYFNKMFPYLKITVATPKLVAPTRRVLSTTNIPPFNSVSYHSFESNIEFEIRFMVDAGVVGCNWIECPPGMTNI